MTHLDLKEVNHDWAGEHRFWQTTNHADPKRAGEIIQDYGLGIYVAQVVDTIDNSTIKDLGKFFMLSDALKALECEIDIKLKVGKLIASADIQYAG